MRLGVWPGGRRGPPRSFAVVGDAAWRPLRFGSLPFQLEWRRPKSSRWELSFRLPAGAVCSGLGENCSGRLNLRSRSWTLFATDDPLHVETMDAMYKSIPLLVVIYRGRSTGLFLDSPARQRWDLDSGLAGRAGVQLLTRRGWQLYAMGPAPLPKIVEAYTRLTGRSHLPPLWSLGHQQSRWSYPDQKTVLSIAKEFRARRIPCDAIVLDIDTMEGYRVFTHSRKNFPGFKKMITDLARRNFRVVTIIDPGVKKDPRYPIYADGLNRGMFCRTSAGKVFIDKVWPGDAAFPDFLRGDVRAWWGSKHAFYFDNGVSGIWNDMNEPSLFNNQKPLPKAAAELPPDGKQLFVQQAPEGPVGHFEVRNLYGFQMSRATFDGWRELRPAERPFILTRSGFFILSSGIIARSDFARRSPGHSVARLKLNAGS